MVKISSFVYYRSLLFIAYFVTEQIIVVLFEGEEVSLFTFPNIIGKGKWSDKKIKDDDKANNIYI